MANRDCDDNRQYICHLKYEKIVHKFDELVSLMDAATNPPKLKRRRVTSGPKRGSKGTGEKCSKSCGVANAESSTGTSGGAADEDEAERSGVLGNAIARHLNDLKTLDHPFDPEVYGSA